MDDTLKERAYKTLLDRLITGHYSPGDFVDRRSAAKELGMSAAPVHEAFMQLEHDGLLEAIPRRGTRIRPVKQADLWGHLVLREALECQAARLICGRLVQDAQDSLNALAIAADTPGPDFAQRCAREVAFHSALVDLAACPPLMAHYRRVMHLGLFYRTNLLLPTQTGGPLHRHSDLLNQLATADPLAAEAATRDHIWCGKPQCLVERRFQPTATTTP